MRCLTTRLIAMALLAAGLGLLLAGTADACIRFDRAAEAHLIDRAIAAPATPAAQRAELKGLRQKMRANRGNQSEQMVPYHNAVSQALKLLGRERIVAQDVPSKPGRRASTVAATGCG
jgi:hypothetical protein